MEWSFAITKRIGRDRVYMIHMMNGIFLRKIELYFKGTIIFHGNKYLKHVGEHFNHELSDLCDQNRKQIFIFHEYINMIDRC